MCGSSEDKQQKFLVRIAVLPMIAAFLFACGGGGGGGESISSPTSLETKASLASDIYGTAQVVTLTANKPATIYYSLNGDMPSMGSAGTISGPSPITDIQISSDTSLLQFFAVDSSGIQESVKSETYVINNGAVTGPGDPQNYYPITEGRVWEYQVTETETGSPTVTYSNRKSISGTKMIRGATAFIRRESNPGNTGIPSEDYGLKSSNGLLFLGDDDPSNIFNQFSPYAILSFPVQPVSRFVVLNETGVDYGEDLDGDNRNETMDFFATVSVKGFESVSVPAGTFLNCLKIESNMAFYVTLSLDKEKLSFHVVETEWLAAGVGKVKSVINMALDNYDYTHTETENLTAYY